MRHAILMVDDDQLILNTLQKHFSTWDMEVYAANNAASAKEVLAKVTPEVILLDVMLTGDEGSTGILDYIEKEPRLSGVPIIILTNLDNEDLKKVLLKRGVKEYLIKGSLTIDDIYDKVLEYLEPKKS